MKDWNVVVTVFDEEGYRLARRLLPRFGSVGTTGYFNVLVMKVEDVAAFTRSIAAWFAETPGYLNAISRVMPAHVVFDFASAEEFLDKAEDAVLAWTDRLADKSFYVRLHRRGFRGDIISPEAERKLDEALLERLDKSGHTGRVKFDEPDYVIDVETVGTRAAVSLWTKEELARYPFLHID